MAARTLEALLSAMRSRDEELVLGEGVEVGGVFD